MSVLIYNAGVLREKWDDNTRTYTSWNSSGVQTTQRAYTTQENAMADAREEQTFADLEDRKVEESQRALLESMTKLSEAAHTNGQAWIQPTGAHNAYAKDVTVTHAGKTWVNLTPFNVSVPGVSGWREVVESGYAAWVQPAGGHDAYAVGAKVSHNGKNWESNTAANVWAPGVYGWVEIP